MLPRSSGGLRSASSQLVSAGSCSPTGGATEKAVENYHVNDATAVHLIMESLDGSAIRLLEYLEPTALILWKALENRFDQNDDERRAELNRLLWSSTATMNESFDVDTHYTDHLSIIARLAALGTIVSANYSRSTFLNSLPEEFDVLASAITVTDMNKVVEQLTTYHRKQQLKRAGERGKTSTADMI
jgi:gag-polypeptide of LTR copia-type